jgi:hypothetical protein
MTFEKGTSATEEILDTVQEVGNQSMPLSGELPVNVIFPESSSVTSLQLSVKGCREVDNRMFGQHFSVVIFQKYLANL